MRQAVPLLMNKLVKFPPRTVCFLGKGIWEVFLREAFRLKLPIRTSVAQNDQGTLPSQRKTKAKTKHFALAQHQLPSKYFPSPVNRNGSIARTAESPSRKDQARDRAPKESFRWGLQLFKIMHRKLGKLSNHSR